MEGLSERLGAFAIYFGYVPDHSEEHNTALHLGQLEFLKEHCFDETSRPGLSSHLIAAKNPLVPVRPQAFLSLHLWTVSQHCFLSQILAIHLIGSHSGSLSANVFKALSNIDTFDCSDGISRATDNGF